MDWFLYDRNLRHERVKVKWNIGLKWVNSMLILERIQDIVKVIDQRFFNNSDKYIHSISPPFLLGDNFQFQVLKWGWESEKNECLGGLKEFLLHISARGLAMFLASKKT